LLLLLLFVGLVTDYITCSAADRAADEGAFCRVAGLMAYYSADACAYT
jgi:hypothetical protein